jgi:hypothetical protein
MDIRSSKGVRIHGPSIKDIHILHRGGAQIPTGHLVQ